MPTTLLTGLPRSGTTLTCALLNELPNAVALAEPMDVLTHSDPELAVSDIASFVVTTRARALDEGLALSKTLDGRLADNFMPPPNASGELRASAAKKMSVVIGKPLTTDFHLFIKHPALFSALAERLSAAFTVFAIVRDPLAVLASWQTVAFPVQKGHLPVAERFVPELARRLALASDRISRQVELMDWLFSIYARLGADRVIRYEDLIADPAAMLLRLHPVANPNAEYRLQAVNVDERYPTVDLKELAQALRPITSTVRPFYPDFEATLDRYLVGRCELPGQRR